MGDERKERQVDEFEYTTTSETWREYGRYAGDSEPREAEVPDPVAPGGKGWRMTGATATPTRLFWFWERNSAHAPATAEVGGSDGARVHGM